MNKQRDVTKGKVKWERDGRNVTGVTRRLGKWDVIRGRELCECAHEGDLTRRGT